MPPDDILKPSTPGGESLPAPIEAPNDSHAMLALAAWLGIQLAALAVSALRVQLSAHYPAAGEQQALAVMLIIQTISISLFFPVLLRSVKWTSICIAVMWPMGQLAGNLADVAPGQLAICEIYVSIWVTALHLWHRALVNDSIRLYAGAIAAMLCAGGPLFIYLHADFADSPGISWRNSIFMSPTLGALAQLSGSHSLWPWTMLILFLAMGYFGFVIQHRRKM